MAKVTIKPAKKTKGNTFDVSFVDMTRGEVLALIHGMKVYSEFSPVGNDVSSYLDNGVIEAAKKDINIL